MLLSVFTCPSLVIMCHNPTYIRSCKHPKLFYLIRKGQKRFKQNRLLPISPVSKSYAHAVLSCLGGFCNELIFGSFQHFAVAVNYIHGWQTGIITVSMVWIAHWFSGDWWLFGGKCFVVVVVLYITVQLKLRKIDWGRYFLFSFCIKLRSHCMSPVAGVEVASA